MHWFWLAAFQLFAQHVHAQNDYLCRSPAHPNPVVLLHGLGANADEDINELASYLQGNDFQSRLKVGQKEYLLSIVDTLIAQVSP